jgi:hypothetical protein
VSLGVPGNYGRGNLDNEVAVDNAGHVFIVWLHLGQLELVTGTFSSGAWTAPQVLGAAAGEPAVGASSSGGLLIAWPDRSSLMGLERPSLAAPFGPVTTIATKQKPTLLHVAEDGAGDVTLVYRGQKKLGYPVRSLTRLAGSSVWGAVQTVAAASARGDGPLLASGADGDGGVAVAFTAPDGSVQASVKPSAATAWPAATTSLGSGVRPVSIDLNAGGSAVVELDRAIPPYDTVSLATFTP